jgi:hypothetical protein
MATSGKFILHIDVNNDAFQPDPNAELGRILREIADRLELRAVSFDKHAPAWLGHFQTIHDANGNDVGRYAVKPEDYR